MFNVVLHEPSGGIPLSVVQCSRTGTSMEGSVFGTSFGNQKMNLSSQRYWIFLSSTTYIRKPQTCITQVDNSSQRSTLELERESTRTTSVVIPSTSATEFQSISVYIEPCGNNYNNLNNHSIDIITVSNPDEEDSHSNKE